MSSPGNDGAKPKRTTRSAPKPWISRQTMLQHFQKTPVPVDWNQIINPPHTADVLQGDALFHAVIHDLVLYERLSVPSGFQEAWKTVIRPDVVDTVAPENLAHDGDQIEGTKRVEVLAVQASLRASSNDIMVRASKSLISGR